MLSAVHSARQESFTSSSCAFTCLGSNNMVWAYRSRLLEIPAIHRDSLSGETRNDGFNQSPHLKVCITLPVKNVLPSGGETRRNETCTHVKRRGDRSSDHSANRNMGKTMEFGRPASVQPSSKSSRTAAGCPSLGPLLHETAVSTGSYWMANPVWP